MKLFFTKFLILCFFICKNNICEAQTKFYATATPKQAAKNEYITYKLTIENGNGDASVSPPSFSGFKVVGGPSQETMVNTVNGVSTQSVSLTYILQPKTSGTFKLFEGVAYVGGQKLESNTVQIVVSNKTVSNQQQNPMPSSPFDDIFAPQKRQQEFDENVIRKNETTQEKVSKNMQFNLLLSKNTCYVGEPIMATYKLYTRLKTESRLDKNPSFNGVSVVDMTNEMDVENYTQEKFEGKLFNVYNVRKAQLYPLQAGVLPIETAILSNRIGFVNYDASGNGNIVSENVNLESKPQSITVLPLPEKNKPANFAGSVGKFNMALQLEKNTFATDEMGKLLVTISGEGNMQLLTLPTIEWPSAFETFETKTTDNTVNSTMPISGSKTFEIPFAISKAGNYTIPTISFSFFNTATKNYETINAPEINFNVKQGTGKLQRPTNIIANNNGSKNKFSFVKLLGSLILLALLAFSYFYFVVNKKKKEITKKEVLNDDLENVKEIFIPSDKNYFEKAKQYLDENNEEFFYPTINEELKNFLAIRYALDKNNIKVASIENELDKIGVQNNLIIATKQLMQKIELETYSPLEKDKNIDIMYNNAQALVQEHIKQKI